MASELDVADQVERRLPMVRLHRIDYVALSGPGDQDSFMEGFEVRSQCHELVAPSHHHEAPRSPQSSTASE